MIEEFYFVREPDHLIECSLNCKGSDFDIIKQRHRIFKTKEEAIEYQKLIGIPPFKIRLRLNKLFKRAGLMKVYGYEKVKPTSTKRRFIVDIKYPECDSLEKAEEYLQELIEGDLVGEDKGRWCVNVREIK